MSSKNLIWGIILGFLLIESSIYAQTTNSSDSSSTGSGIGFGRYFRETDPAKRKSVKFDFNIGIMNEFDGNIAETKRAGRPFDENRDEYERYLENYSLKELGFEEKHILGIHFEKQWRYVTLKILAGYFTQEATTTNDREIFALTVDEISFEGQEYEHMLIPQGSTFDTEFNGGIFEPQLLITPFHFNLSDTINFTPWVFVGIYSLGGKFEIDAGPATDLTTYEFHPHLYVVGGKADGWFGLGLPEYGIGGHLEIGLDDFLTFNAEVSLAALNWDGSTGDLGVSVRHDKNVDLDFTNFSLNAYVSFEMFEYFDILVGIKIQKIEADAEINAIIKSDEEQELLKEKYDKEASFNISTTFLYAGIRF